jgi:hypothetical protein
LREIMEAIMPTKEFEKSVYEGCLKAVNELGPRVKEMACFLPNWEGILAKPEAAEKAA